MQCLTHILNSQNFCTDEELDYQPVFSYIYRSISPNVKIVSFLRCVADLTMDLAF